MEVYHQACDWSIGAIVVDISQSQASKQICILNFPHHLSECLYNFNNRNHWSLRKAVAWFHVCHYHSADEGKGTWCYTTGWNNKCKDLKKSRQFPNNPWSYQACRILELKLKKRNDAISPGSTEYVTDLKRLRGKNTKYLNPSILTDWSRV